MQLATSSVCDSRSPSASASSSDDIRSSPGALRRFSGELAEVLLELRRRLVAALGDVGSDRLLAGPGEVPRELS